jgi:hypothetical protein
MNRPELPCHMCPFGEDEVPASLAGLQLHVSPATGTCTEYTGYCENSGTGWLPYDSVGSTAPATLPALAICVCYSLAADLSPKPFPLQFALYPPSRGSWLKVSGLCCPSAWSVSGPDSAGAHLTYFLCAKL